MIVLLFMGVAVHAQVKSLPPAMEKTMIAKLAVGDSLVYYQCHVEEMQQSLATASGQTLSTAPQKYSLTEKFVVSRKDSGTYKVRSYVSSMIVLPNRRFSGLKIREKPYWNFKFQKEGPLNDIAFRNLAVIESKGKEPNEYDFAITKYNTNQVIIKQRKNFKQLVMEGNYILSRLIFE